MSSFRERYGKLTVAQAIEMNNVAWKYQKDCDWDPDYEYENIKSVKGVKYGTTKKRNT